jgi:predicted XRE-type DNA-binding protein
MNVSEPYDNVFDALEADPAIAANLRVRAMLIHALRDYIERQGITQTEAARRFGVTQPRVSDRVRGRIERFTVDTLLNMLGRVGIRADISLASEAA